MKNIKAHYEQADVRIIWFDGSDVITTSQGTEVGEMDGGEGGGWDVN